MKKMLLIAVVAFAANAQAGMFKCLDAGGKRSYQEMPCAEGAKSVNSEVTNRVRPKSNLPCDVATVNAAEKKLAVYAIGSSSRSISSMQSGGSVERQVGAFRKASAEAGNIPVPQCMEHARDVLQKFLEFTADRLSALSNRHSFESADARSADLRAEYQAAIDAARNEAAETGAHVWATKNQ